MNNKKVFIIISIILIIFLIANELIYQASYQESIIKYATEEDIISKKNITNIYLFWSEECGYCKEELSYLNKLRKKDDSFMVYAFEISKNKENVFLTQKFEDVLNTTITGVPFTVIGADYFAGFSESSESKIKEMINNQKKNNTDVYINDIK